MPADWSHGFSPVFKDQTGIESPKDCDVILCAPKGSGRTVRTLFKVRTHAAVRCRPSLPPC